jgi:hypothetical protein
MAHGVLFGSVDPSPAPRCEIHSTTEHMGSPQGILTRDLFSQYEYIKKSYATPAAE